MPSLNNPPVKEVSFDIRFASEHISYDKLQGKLLRELGKKYPKDRKTKDGQIISEDVPLPIILKQFLTEEEKQLIGVGNGVLSIHTLEHNNFSEFKPQILEILEFLKQLGLTKQITRLGLRYIDEFKNSSLEVLYKDINFPLNDFEDKGKNLLYVMQSEDDILNLRIIESIEQENMFFLDTDLYNEKIRNIENVSSWLENAHKKLYSAFSNAINTDYFNSNIQ